MIENVRDASQYLYHYTSSTTAVDHILKSGLLRFGNYTRTNDPKETKTWQFSFGTNTNRDLGAYKMTEESAWLSSRLKSRARLLCFCMDSAPLSGIHMTDIFRRGFCKPRMWAQYASNHTGVCLVFDRELLSAAIEKQVAKSHLVLSGAVEYVDRGIASDLFKDQQYMINVDFLEEVGRDHYPRHHLETHHRRLFFEKMMDWRDESEWRFIAFANSDQDLFVAYGSSLVGIMFGEDTPIDVIRSIMGVPGSRRYMGLKWKNCSPWYDYGNLLYTPGIEKSPWSKFVPQA